MSSALGDGATRAPGRIATRASGTMPTRRSHVQHAPRPELHLSSCRRRGTRFRWTRRSAARGAAIYESAVRGLPRARRPRTGTVIPMDEVGTDRHRLDMWTKAAATAYNAYGEGHAWEFSALPEDQRLRAVPLRRPVAARALSPQRIGADAGGPARAAGRAAEAVLARLRRRAIRCASASCPAGPRPSGWARPTTRPRPATATPATPTAPRCSAGDKLALLEYLKTL